MPAPRLGSPITISELADQTEVALSRGLADPAAVDVQVLDATHDSRAVEEGSLFCAIPGEVVDGHQFVEKAADSGACALLVEKEVDVALPQFVVGDSRRSMGIFANAIHGNPSEDLTVVGVTGTNGKSSFVQILSDIWNAAGIAGETYGTVTGTRTTPESSDLQRKLRLTANAGKDAVAMEVSSHALSLGRVVGTTFAAGVFTNLGHDHLDFHGTMEEYFEAKAMLFDSSLIRVGVINADDPYGAKLLARDKVDSVAFQLADAKDLEIKGAVTSFRWRGVPVELHLAGMHNVSNALAAATAAEALGIDPVTIADGLCATSPVRGRFEFVDLGQPFKVAVDYAHTPDALTAALRAAKSLAPNGNVLLVFGCGGDRDKEKRPMMGQVANEYADQVILTSDNPRSEDPTAIIDEILSGVDSASWATIELDREVAIQTAIAKADKNDLVLVAGKGHETKQIIGDVVSHFDDREAVLRALGVPS